MSHFFQLALPPLFPLLRAEFGIELRGARHAGRRLLRGERHLAVRCRASRSIAWAPGPVLLAGLALAAGGTIVASLVPGIGWLFPIVALMGVGNGVFHPSDFAILNASVAPRRLGHAYSTHGIGGNLGYALAPVVSFALGTAFGWRLALAGMGVIGLVALGDRWRASARCSIRTGPRTAHLALR